MRIIVCALLLVGTHVCAHAQASVLKDNGTNLEKYCDLPGCLYANFESQIVYPEDSSVQWVMQNFEIAMDESGKYLITSDFFVTGDDLGAVIDLEIQLYDERGDKIGSFDTGEQSIYAESGDAEPFVCSGTVADSVSVRTAYFGMKISKSRIVPYFEIENNCFLPCKRHHLDQEIRDFKKS